MAALEGRTARCAYYGRPTKYPIDDTGLCLSERPSSTDLAFFEYKGAESRWADTICICNMADVAHGPINPETRRGGIVDHPFTPRGPAEFDEYYCGCHGWD